MTRLKQQPGKDIVAQGGAGFAQGLAASGLIEEYRRVVHPLSRHVEVANETGMGPKCSRQSTTFA